MNHNQLMTKYLSLHFSYENIKGKNKAKHVIHTQSEILLYNQLRPSYHHHV